MAALLLAKGPSGAGEGWEYAKALPIGVEELPEEEDSEEVSEDGEEEEEGSEGSEE